MTIEPHLCGCTAWFVLDLVRNPEERVSHDVAQLLATIMTVLKFQTDDPRELCKLPEEHSDQDVMACINPNRSKLKDGLIMSLNVKA